jgi:hypothetical protein
MFCLNTLKDCSWCQRSWRVGTLVTTFLPWDPIPWLSILPKSKSKTKRASTHFTRVILRQEICMHGEQNPLQGCVVGVGISSFQRSPLDMM